MGNTVLNPKVPLGDLKHSPLDPFHLMGKSPTPPPTPDYAAANTAAIQADANTLPLRNAINAAATMGTSYTDPSTGHVYDFTGMGAADVNHKQTMQELADAPAQAQALLDLQKAYGGQFAAENTAQLRATDPTGFALRDQMGGNLLNGSNSNESLVSGANQLNAPTYESLKGDGPIQKMLSGSPEFQNVSGIKLADAGAAQAGRADLERGVFDQLSQVGQQDPTLTRAAEQAARARGASSGNTYGDGSAMNEALAVQQQQLALDDKRRMDAQNLLASGQTTSDKTNELAKQQQQSDIASSGFNNANAQQSFSNQAAIVDQNNNAGNQAFQNAMSAIGQRNQSLQNTFAGQQSVQAQQLGARQQDIANQQSYLGLAPVVSQAAQLGNVQGAAPFNPTSASYNATLTNPGAGQQGAEWAGQLYGAQSAQGASAAGTKNANVGAGASVAAAAIIAI